MKKIFSVAALAVSCHLDAAEINPTTVAKVRSYSSNQATIAARNYTVFTIEAPLTAGCTCLYLNPVDKEALSLLLMAKAQKSNILVGYEEGVRAPFNNTACAAVHIEIL